MWVLVEGILLNQIVNEGYSYRVDKQFIRFAGFSFGTATLVALVGAVVMSVTSTYVNQAQDMSVISFFVTDFFLFMVTDSLVTDSLTDSLKNQQSSKQKKIHGIFKEIVSF